MVADAVVLMALSVRHRARRIPGVCQTLPGINQIPSRHVTSKRQTTLGESRDVSSGLGSRLISFTRSLISIAIKGYARGSRLACLRPSSLEHREASKRMDWIVSHRG